MRYQCTPEDAARFWAKVNKDGPVVRADLGPCWMWVGGSTGTGGYGHISFRRSGARWTVSTHRFSWVLTHGPIADDLWVLHRCDTPPCVNPGHLFLGTPSDNSRDMVAKGRYMVNDRNPMAMPEVRDRLKQRRRAQAKLSTERIVEIRLLAGGGRSRSSLAEQFGVSRSLIDQVLWRRIWADVD